MYSQSSTNQEYQISIGDETIKATSALNQAAQNYDKQVNSNNRQDSYAEGLLQIGANGGEALSTITIPGIGPIGGLTQMAFNNALVLYEAYKQTRNAKLEDNFVEEWNLRLNDLRARAAIAVNLSDLEAQNLIMNSFISAVGNANVPEAQKLQLVIAASEIQLQNTQFNAQTTQQTKALVQEYGQASQAEHKVINIKLDNLQAGFNHMAGEVVAIKEMVAGSAEKIQLLTDQVAVLQTTVQQNTLTLNELKTMTNFLFEKALDISSQGLEHNANVMGLLNQYNSLRNEYEAIKNNPTILDATKQAKLNQLLSKRNELGTEIAKDQAIYADISSAYTQFTQYGALLSNIAILAGFPAQAKMINDISQGVASIGLGIAAGALGSSLALTAVGGGALGAVVAISGGIVKLVGAFNDTPTPEQQIMESIQKLSKQIADGFNAMNNRFNTIEYILSRVSNQIYDLQVSVQKQLASLQVDIYRVGKLLNQFYFDSLQSFQTLQQSIISLSSMVTAIQDHLVSIDNKLDAGFRDIFSQGYKKFRIEALSYHILNPYPQIVLPVETAHSWFIAFYDRSVSQARSDTLSDDASALELINLSHFNEDDILYKINYLRRLAERYYRLPPLPEAVVNPLVWADASEVLMEFLLRTPEYKITPNHRLYTQEIINDGESFLDFIYSLKLNPSLFTQLVTSYRQTLNLIVDRIFDVTKQDVTLEKMRALKGNIINKAYSALEMTEYDGDPLPTKAERDSAKNTFITFNSIITRAVDLEWNYGCGYVAGFDWSQGGKPIYEKRQVAKNWITNNCGSKIQNAFTAFDNYIVKRERGIPDIRNYLRNRWDGMNIQANATINFSNTSQPLPGSGTHLADFLMQESSSLYSKLFYLAPTSAPYSPIDINCMGINIDNLLRECMPVKGLPNLPTQVTAAKAVLERLADINEFDAQFKNKLAVVKQTSGLTCGNLDYENAQRTEYFDNEACPYGYVNRMQWCQFEIFFSNDKLTALNKWFTQLYQPECELTTNIPYQSTPPNKLNYFEWIKQRLDKEVRDIVNNPTYISYLTQLDTAFIALNYYLQLAFGSEFGRDEITTSVLNYIPTRATLENIMSRYSALETLTSQEKWFSLPVANRTLSFVTSDFRPLLTTLTDFTNYLITRTNTTRTPTTNTTIVSGYPHIDKVLSHLKAFQEIFPESYTTLPIRSSSAIPFSSSVKQVSSSSNVGPKSSSVGRSSSSGKPLSRSSSSSTGGSSSSRLRGSSSQIPSSGSLSSSGKPLSRSSSSSTRGQQSSSVALFSSSAKRGSSSLAFSTRGSKSSSVVPSSSSEKPSSSVIPSSSIVYSSSSGVAFTTDSNTLSTGVVAGISTGVGVLALLGIGLFSSSIDRRRMIAEVQAVSSITSAITPIPAAMIAMSEMATKAQSASVFISEQTDITMASTNFPQALFTVEEDSTLFDMTHGVTNDTAIETTLEPRLDELAEPFDRTNNQSALTVIFASNQQNTNSLPIPFNSGAWDPTIQQHSQTGEPVFVYRVYQDGAEVGSASFYKHPLLCRSEAGDRHNIIATTGVLSQFKTETSSIEEICAALPPTMFDTVIISAAQGAEHGAVRGISNVIGYTLHARHVSKKIAEGIQQFTYYGGYFLLRYNDYISQKQEVNWQDVLHSAYQAAVDTGSVLVVNMFVNQLCQAAHQLSQRATQSGWSKTGKALKFFGDHGSYGVYVSNAKQQGIENTAASVVAGIATQYVVERAGYAANRFFKPAVEPKRSETPTHVGSPCTDKVCLP